MTRIEGLQLIDLMEAIEKIAEFISELCVQRDKINIDLLSEEEDSENRNTLCFNISRNKAKYVQVQAVVDANSVRECKVIALVAEPESDHDYYFKKERKVTDLGDLKNCICSHLVPSLRIVAILKEILADRLHLEFFVNVFSNNSIEGPPRLLVIPHSEQNDSMYIWLDKDDSIHVGLGRPDAEKFHEQKFDLDDPDDFIGKTCVCDEMSLVRYHFFEDPFLEEAIENSVPVLLPRSKNIISYVLGNLALQNLDFWDAASVKVSEEVGLFKTTTQKTTTQDIRESAGG